MTKARRQLLDDAIANGFEIVERTGYLYILKYQKTPNGGKYLRHGLILYEDGTAFDATVPLSAAKGFRSYADMRSVLRI